MGLVPTAYLADAPLYASAPALTEEDSAARRLFASIAEICESAADILSARSYRVVKRWIDVVFSVSAIAALFPVLVFIGLAVWLEDGGPALFAQDRIGRGGRRFRIYKFRSMVRDAESAYEELRGLSDDGNDVRFKMRKDPRLTWVGRLLRRFSLDELPQLWNVLRGEMSMVGPRPPLPCEVQRYDARAKQRLRVKPGLTCTWQVSGRADIPFEQQVELDLDYIKSHSTALDIWLIARTVPAIVSGRGAY
jgi:lipopolysaccharide/colanic/teichoic acid biosynthesis glycosyltransferase